MAKRQFKTESKRILDLMVNSIYTHREIFLRELISNASDAIDKLCYRSLTDDGVGLGRDDFFISVEADKDARTVKITDNGIGMTAEELESNLGVIARSGSLKFKSELKESEAETDVDIIGQFGVGFYSAFMVASKVTVVSKAYGAESANMWQSSGADGYTITPCEKETAGTEITLVIKADTEGENYSEFLEEYRIRELIKRYSDFIRWPIKLSDETVNSMVPIWQRPKSEVTDEDCFKFYKETFFDGNDPLSVLRIAAEGAAVSFKSMLFIPSAAPYNFYTASYEAGPRLYASGVMIMDACRELLPEHFRFVRGIVDSQDLSLNISREMLQHDRQLKTIAANLEKKIKNELKRMMDSDREKYERFWQSFGLQIKYGLINGFGINRDKLSDLLLFKSAKEDRYVSLHEYVAAMPEGQKYIYYVVTESEAIAKGLPQAERVIDAGYDILYMTENVDEFAAEIVGEFEGKQLRSINDDDLGLDEGEAKADAEKSGEEYKELFDFVKDALGESVAAVKASQKLKSHPVCLTSQGPISLEMEKYLSSIPTSEGGGAKAERVLEINTEHAVFDALINAYDSDKEKAKRYAKLLYWQSLLTAGMPIPDPAEFAAAINELMV